MMQKHKAFLTLKKIKSKIMKKSSLNTLLYDQTLKKIMRYFCTDKNNHFVEWYWVF